MADLTDACQEWDLDTNSRGYGRVRIKERWHLAHRMVWAEAHGQIPKGMFVCHRCDNPPCINIDHLFLGTPRDNTQDMMSKGRCRSGGPAGEQSSAAKLTLAQVAEIRRLRTNGLTHKAIAARFGVGRTTVSAIIARRNWR
jgi:hypothetical protein